MVEQTEPDGRDAHRRSHVFAVQQVEERGRIAMAAGHDHGRARHGRGVGQAPGIDVEHRHDGKDPIDRAQTDRIGKIHRHGVQHGRAMRKQHALGPTGGARRVTERRGGILVEARPVRFVGRGGEQGFITIQSDLGGQGAGLHLFRLGQDHHAAQNSGEFGGDRLDHGKETGIGENQPVFRMAGDIGDVVG